MKYIYQNTGWPSFTWDKDLIGAKLAKVNKAAGILEGRLIAIGFVRPTERTRFTFMLD